MGLNFSNEHIRLMYDHAREKYPSECVGAIIGDGKDPATNRLIRLSNVQDKMHSGDPEKYNRDSRTAFFVDPKEVFDLFRKVDEEGLKMIALYHSHPDHDCFFSQEDHNAAVMWDEPVFPGVSYIVISVYGGKVKGAKVFTWDGKTYVPTQTLNPQ